MLAGITFNEVWQNDVKNIGPSFREPRDVFVYPPCGNNDKWVLKIWLVQTLAAAMFKYSLNKYEMSPKRFFGKIDIYGICISQLNMLQHQAKSFHKLLVSKITGILFYILK